MVRHAGHGPTQLNPLLGILPHLTQGALLSGEKLHPKLVATDEGVGTPQHEAVAAALVLQEPRQAAAVMEHHAHRRVRRDDLGTGDVPLVSQAVCELEPLVGWIGDDDIDDALVHPGLHKRYHTPHGEHCRPSRTRHRRGGRQAAADTPCGSAARSGARGAAGRASRVAAHHGNGGHRRGHGALHAQRHARADGGPQARRGCGQRGGAAAHHSAHGHHHGGCRQIHDVRAPQAQVGALDQQARAEPPALGAVVALLQLMHVGHACTWSTPAARLGSSLSSNMADMPLKFASMGTLTGSTLHG